MSANRGGPVAVDPRYGHIRVDEVTFCDMGPVLSVWSHEGATLTPETASDLAGALRAWSEKAALRVERVAAQAHGGDGSQLVLGVEDGAA